MKTQEIAQRLVTYCRQGKTETAQKELFANDAVSIEPHETPMFKKETRGLPAIIEKGHKFGAMIEQVHVNEVSDPVVTENAFACTMTMDLTVKGKGRQKMSELCVYDVKNGKIVSEQFHV